MLVKFDPHSFEPWFQKFIWSISTLMVILLVGSFGYWWLGGEGITWFDGLYMTIITVKNQKEWLYNPPKTYILQPSDLVVIMTTEDEKDALKNDLDALT